MPTEIELQDGWINPNPDLFIRTYRTKDGKRTGKHVIMKPKQESYWIVGLELPGQNIKWRSSFEDADDAMFDAYREVHELGLTYRAKENGTSNTNPQFGTSPDAAENQQTPTAHRGLLPESDLSQRLLTRKQKQYTRSIRKPTLTTRLNSVITDPAIAELLAPSDKRDWNLTNLLTNYPWLHSSNLDKTMVGLSETTMTPEHNQNMLAEIEHIQSYYALSVDNMQTQRDHLMAEAVLKNAWPEFAALPKPEDFFMVDDDSIANGVLRQHWVIAMSEWVESEPEPDEKGVAICNMMPDDYCEVPFSIEMRSMPAPAETDHQVIHLSAYIYTGDLAGTYAGTAIWMMHVPSIK